ncbi:Filaggrin-2 like [Melia azedarach]|uniref:Filaggrin-2 like n=1 Tax=Melia azedarach TaxID=155640 RepID=A0ACC1WPN0_MELAZ|nr:Filaggrin-2 like [Melia azedarach]
MVKPMEVSSNKKDPGGEMGGAPTEPRFRSKKGSVIPAKRRSVKRMMFDQFVQSLVSLFGSVKKQVSTAAPKSSKTNDNAVFPYS